MADGHARPAVTSVDLLLQHVVRTRLEALFRRGERVLDLGCGTGEDALHLVSRGVRLVALDPSPARIGRARQSAAERGVSPDECRFEVLEAHRAVAAGTGFDGAYAGLGGLDEADLPAVGAALAAAVRPGGSVLLSLRGPRPLPAVVRRTLTGVGEPRRGRIAYPPLDEARAALGAPFLWTDAYALGALLPGPEHERWAREHPQTFAFLAALERAVRRWPALRQLGEHVVLEGRRRGP